MVRRNTMASGNDGMVSCGAFRGNEQGFVQ